MSELTKYLRCHLNLHRWGKWSEPYEYKNETYYITHHLDGTVTKNPNPMVEIYNRQARRCLACNCEQTRRVIK